MSEHDRPIDPTLSVLVSGINALTTNQSGGPGLSLTVQGVIITGQLIPHWVWFEDVEKQCRAAFEAAGGSPDDPDAGGYPVVFKEVRAQLQAAQEENQAMDDVLDQLAIRFQRALLSVDETLFIHLKNAQAFPAGSASPLPTNSEMYWRGKLTDVSGWSFGQLVATPGV